MAQRSRPRPRASPRLLRIVILATALGIGLNFTPIDPIKALFWSAVINGVVAVPVMIVMMLMARRKVVMGGFIISRRSCRPRLGRHDRHGRHGDRDVRDVGAHLKAS